MRNCYAVQENKMLLCKDVAQMANILLYISFLQNTYLVCVKFEISNHLRPAVNIFAYQKVGSSTECIGSEKMTGMPNLELYV